jgi:hypothetical protein
MTIWDFVWRAFNRTGSPHRWSIIGLILWEMLFGIGRDRMQGAGD